MTFVGSPFVGIATFRSPQAQADSAVATVRRVTDGGSLLEAWNETLIRSTGARTIDAQTLTVEEVGTSPTGGFVVAGRTAPGASQSFAVVKLDPTNGFADVGSGLSSVEAVTAGARVVRVRLLSNSPDAIVLVERASMNSATVFRMSMPTPPGLTFTSAGTTPNLRGRDVVEAPLGALVVATRCGGAGVFCNIDALQAVNSASSIGWWTSIPVLPMGGALDMPTEHRLFDGTEGTGALRVGTDGPYLYVAAETTSGLLLLQRWALQAGATRIDEQISTAPMTPVDLIPSPTGSGVLVLAKTTTSNTLGGLVLPHTSGNQANVVLIHTGPLATRAVAFDLPGDQDPLGLATIRIPNTSPATDPVLIVENEGSHGVLWRTRLP